MLLISDRCQSLLLLSDLMLPFFRDSCSKREALTILSEDPFFFGIKTVSIVLCPPTNDTSLLSMSSFQDKLVL